MRKRWRRREGGEVRNKKGVGKARSRAWIEVTGASSGRGKSAGYRERPAAISRV